MGYVTTPTGEWVDDDSLDMQGLAGLGDLQSATAALLDGDTTNILKPAVGVSSTVPCALYPTTSVWSLFVASTDDADTVTVYETIDGVETVIGTLVVPANDPTGVSDSYQKQFRATYRCAQAGSATLTAEVM